jgi:hypothetical protein
LHATSRSIVPICVELLDNNYTLIELKQAEDIPFGAIEYSGLFEFLNLTPGRSYIGKLYAVYINDHITSLEEYMNIVDMTTPVINQFQVYSPTTGHVKVDVNV